MAFTGLKWATGFNNAAGLVSVEDTAPTYMGSGLILMARPVDDGIKRARPDKLNYTTGFQTIVWVAAAMSDDQYNYIQDTFTVGGISYSGKMTIRTQIQANTATYANYSVVLDLPKPNELERVPGGFLNVEIRYIVEAAL